MDAPESDVIGEVTDLTFFGNGNIVILDAKSSRVTLLNPDLTSLAQTGKNGGGPGEFSAPSAVAVLNDTVLAVGERGSQRISLFRNEADSLTFVRSFRVDHDILDMCVLGDALVVQGAKGGFPLQTYDLSGKALGSFGTALEVSPKHPVMQQYSQAGAITCDPKNHTVSFSASALAFIQTYDANGQLLAVDSVPEFVGTRFIPRGAGLEVSLPDEGYADAVIRLSQGWDSSSVVVQVVRSKLSSGTRRIKEYRSYLYDARRSPPFTPVVGSPNVPFDVKGVHLYLMSHDPYPRMQASPPMTALR